MLLLHDMTLLNTHFAKDMKAEEKVSFLELWDKFYEEEMIAEFDRIKVKEEGLPPIFRVVPVDEEIIPSQEVLAYDTVKGIINKANLISVQPCVCRIRTHGKNCKYPIEVCMAFGIVTVYSALFATGFWIYGQIAGAGIGTLITIISAVILFKSFSKLKVS